MEGYELTQRPAWAQGHQLQVQWSDQPMTPAGVDHNLRTLALALEMASGDVAAAMDVRDEAQRQQVAYAAMGLRDASLRANGIVMRAERAVAQAPKQTAGRPPENATPGGSIIGDSQPAQNQRSKIRNAHEHVSDEQFEALVAKSVESGEPLTRKAVAEVGRANAREQAKEERKAELAAQTPAAVNDRWSVEHATIDEFRRSFRPESVDVIFTDPPYGREWIEVYYELSEFAGRVLRDEGVLICLTGHAHLPDIIEGLQNRPEMRYLWTASYQFGGKTLTQPASHQVLLQVGWKPILLFGTTRHKGSWFANASDLVLAPEPALDDDRKERHKWGQQQGGMTAILRQFTRDFQPGALVVDPFVGSGTNGVAALELGFRFRGADADADACAVARGYINERFG